MNWTVHKATLLLLVVVVAVGVFVVLTEFNNMLGPANGISALGIEENKSGVYRIEFLGEQAYLDIPKIKESVAPLYYSLLDYSIQFTIFIENNKPLLKRILNRVGLEAATK